VSDGLTATTGAGSQSNGILGGTGTFTVTNDFTWSGGSQNGTGTTEVNGALTLSGGTMYIRDGRILEANGGGSWSSGNVYFYNGSAFNTTAGTFDILGNATFVNSTGGGIWNNAGTAVKSGGTGRTDVRIAFNNTGAATSNSGILEFSGGGSSTGAFDGTATVEFGGGTRDR